MSNATCISVNVSIDNQLFDNADFGSDVTFLGYDLVVINIENVIADYAFSTDIETNFLIIEEGQHYKFKRDYGRRIQEFKELYERGKCVVLLNPKNTKCHVFNSRSPAEYDDYDLLKLFPIRNIKQVIAKGNNIEKVGNSVVEEYWEKNRHWLEYSSYFEGKFKHPLFCIRGTDKVVGFYELYANGVFLCLPSTIEVDQRDVKEKAEIRERFTESLIQLYEKAQNLAGDFNIPSWAKSYLLPEEESKKSRIAQIELELERLGSDLKELQSFKTIFTSSGKVLENTVKSILSEIGFACEESKKKRHDLIITYEDKTAVVEVKGLTKSAAEKDVAQLEKWVGEYYAETRVVPKGLLVVNVYRDKELQDRTDEAFPNQMIDYSKTRNHCLLTTIQLLNIFYDVQKNPEKKDSLIKRIFDTAGVFESHEDWSKCIRHVEHKQL